MDQSFSLNLLAYCRVEDGDTAIVNSGKKVGTATAFCDGNEKVTIGCVVSC